MPPCLARPPKKKGRERERATGIVTAVTPGKKNQRDPTPGDGQTPPVVDPTGTLAPGTRFLMSRMLEADLKAGIVEPREKPAE